MTHSPRRLLATFGLATALSLTVAGVAFGGGIRAATDWPILRGDVQRRGVAEEKVVPPLSLLWKFTAASLAANGAAPAVVGNTVYYAARGSYNPTSGGMVFALDTKTGQRKWQFPGGDGLRDRAIFLTAPQIYNGKLYIGASDGNVYVLNTENGEEVKRYRAGGPVYSAPTLVNDILMFGANDGTFYAIDTKTDEPAWRTADRPGDAINSAPVIGDTFIYLTSRDSSVYAVQRATGRIKWKYRLPFRVLNNAAVYAENSLFVPSGQRLTAFQPTSGIPRWQRDMPNDILAAPVVDSGVLYIVNRDQRGNGAEINAIRAQNGKNLWLKPAALPAVPSAAPLLSGDVIYIPTNKNVVVAVSREDGRVLWQYELEPAVGRPGAMAAASTEVTAPISISDGTVYVLSDDGSLSAFRPDAPDATGPSVTVAYPPAGTAVSGQPPLTVAAYVRDMGTGIDPSTLTMKLDGRDVTATFDPTRSLIIYATRSSGRLVDPPLPNGRHNATVMAKDWRGNVTEESWSFVVNNSLRPPTSRETPAAPRVTRPSADTPPPGGRRGGGGRRGNQGNPPQGNPTPVNPPAPPLQ